MKRNFFALKLLLQCFTSLNRLPSGDHAMVDVMYVTICSCKGITRCFIWWSPEGNKKESELRSKMSTFLSPRRL